MPECLHLVECPSRHEMVGLVDGADFFNIHVEIPREPVDIPAWVIALALGYQDGAITFSCRRANFVWNATDLADAAILVDCAGHSDSSLDTISFQKSRKSDRHDRTGARAVGSG